jgi:hypothetical protein
MFIVWQGNGIVAMAALAAMCIPCVSAIGDKKDMPIGAFVGGVFGAVGAWLCIRYGRRWNHAGTAHSMYWIPLQAWGYIIGVFAAFGLVTGTVGLVKRLMN